MVISRISWADLHLVISRTCWLQKVTILRGGRLGQVLLPPNKGEPPATDNTSGGSNRPARRRSGVVLIYDQRRRRWANVKLLVGPCPTRCQCLKFKPTGWKLVKNLPLGHPLHVHVTAGAKPSSGASKIWRKGGARCFGGLSPIFFR